MAIEPVYLVSIAYKQGQISGENAVDNSREFAGTLGTQVVKIFDRVAARTGLRQQEATQAGFTPITIETDSSDHKVYYSGAEKMRIQVLEMSIQVDD